MSDNNLNTNETAVITANESADLRGHCAEVKSMPQSLTEQTPGSSCCYYTRTSSC